MPKLVLGPLLRYVGETQATVWVETDDAARVEVLVSPGGPGQEADGGTRGQAPTFQVQGHHYALVLIDGLEPDRVYTYRVELDGEPVWPEPVAPPGAHEASARYPWYEEHPFPTCFVCGPRRPDRDGLSIFAGRVAGREVYACDWTPASEWDRGDGLVENLERPANRPRCS